MIAVGVRLRHESLPVAKFLGLLHLNDRLFLLAESFLSVGPFFESPDDNFSDHGDIDSAKCLGDSLKLNDPPSPLSESFHSLKEPVPAMFLLIN